MENEQPTKKEEESVSAKKEGPSPYLMPGAIIIAGMFIAGAILWNDLAPIAGVGGSDTFENNLSAAAQNIRPVSDDEHIRGDINAAYTIIEYSDFECPYCSSFHPTLSRIVDEHPDVRWVYRHFPLTSIHSNAANAALASECAARIGGNDVFWNYADLLFENQRQLGDKLYVSLAESLGISQDAFIACFSSEEAQQAVSRDFQNAVDSGGTGTPFNIIVTADGNYFPFSGALTYEQVRDLLNTARELESR